MPKKRSGKKQSTSTAEARQSTVQGLLRGLGGSVYTELDEGRFPSLTLASRSVRNIVYDKKLQQFVLGPTTVKKSSGNIKHIRPFTQLVWLAYFAKKLVDEKRTSTLRDVFYSAQAFNVEFQDQAESDELITDLEVLMQMAREGMNIFPEERSAIFGNMRIEYTVPGYEGKIADLSANPDGVMIGPALTTAEFRDTDAEMVLAIEKGGLFTRFTEERVHQKYKAILINTAGQPPRSTRYLIRRLNQELGLPVGILCDSVVGSEPILVRKETVPVYLTMRKLAGILFGSEASGGPEWRLVDGEGWECMGMNQDTNRIEWMPITCVYRHMAKEQLYRVQFDDGREITITRGHSLFTLKEGQPTPTSLVKVSRGDFVLMPHRLPPLTPEQPRTYDLLEYNSTDSKLIERNGLLFYPATARATTPRLVTMSEDLAWILGFWIAEGSYSAGRYIDFSQSLKNLAKANELVRRIRNAFGIEPAIRVSERERTTEIRITIGRKVLLNFFQRALGIKDLPLEEKEFPSVIWQFPKGLQERFVEGMLAGDGHIDDDSKETMYSTKSATLASQLSYLLFSIGLGNSVKKDAKGQFSVYVHGYNARRLSPFLPVDSFPELFGFSGFGLFQRKQGKVSYPRITPRVHGMLAALEQVARTGRGKRGLLAYLIRKGCLKMKEGRYVLTQRGVQCMRILERAEVLLTGDVHPVRIERIDPLPAGELVYDLTVEKGRSFIAGRSCTLLHNSDPWGAHIAMVIKSGSANAAHLRELTTPNSVWLGVWPSDIIKYKLPSDKLTDIDIKRVYELKADPRYTEKMWHDELELFLKHKRKSEQEAFARYGLSYIVDRYLPDKLELMKSA